MKTRIKAPKIKMHNEYDIIVKDSVSGKETQRFKAYNTTNPTQVAAYLSRPNSNENYHSQGIKRMNIGRGVGTPTASDTALFDQIGIKTVTRESYELDRALSTATYKVTIGETEYVGETITELGLSTEYKTGYSSYVYYLISHALLKDSEGNPISIGPKTDTQIIEIYATVYIEIASEDAGSGWKWYKSNMYNKGVILGMAPFPEPGEYSTNYLGGYIRPNNLKIPVSYSKTGDISTHVFDRLLSTEGNTGDIIGVGFEELGYIPFPNTTYFPTMSFAEQSIGTGDGEETKFNLATNYLVPASEIIKVNNVLQAEGTDYTASQNIGIIQSEYPIPRMPEVRAYSGSDSTGEELILRVGGGLAHSDGSHLDTAEDVFIDIGAELFIPSVDFGWQSQSSVAIYASLDNINWDTIRAWSVGSPTPGTGQSVNTEYRYFKFCHSGGYYWLTAAKIYTDKSIKFTTPPAADAAITASWDTDIPPKTSDYSYDFELEIDWS